MKKLFLICWSILLSGKTFAQTIKLENSNLIANQVSMAFENWNGEKILKVTKDTTIKAVDEPTFVRIKNLDFQDGIIEVKVLSRLLKTARPSDRGFIGIAFRIDEQNSKYESIYIRPTNGRAEDQVRRNHSVQYYCYPNYKFDRLRKESPEKYETYADMGLNEWITMRVEIKGNSVKLYLNNQKSPNFIVNEMLGNSKSGGIALWVDVGTEGYFKDLTIIKNYSE
ncbi:MAG: DUF1080 domain-containing protein [Arcicella sp.]|jgi:hypothetical protein|nr:DUF1080 domain-containing protein [Arcicella sp.]